MNKTHICSWCGQRIIQSAHMRTFSRNGKREYYHYHYGKDCFADMLTAKVRIRNRHPDDDYMM